MAVTDMLSVEVVGKTASALAEINDGDSLVWLELEGSERAGEVDIATTRMPTGQSDSVFPIECRN